MQNLIEAKEIFNELYREIDGISISLSERNKLNITSKEFVYGEIEFDSFIELLEKIKPSPEDIFYDLGSGTGKPCIAISLAYDIKKAVGYEILESLWEVSNQILKKLKEKIQKNLPEIEFRRGNFLEEDISDGTIIFSHATCFEDSTMEKLEEKLKKLKNGSRIILITKKLKSNNFKLLDEGEKKMSWGYATYRIYEKID